MVSWTDRTVTRDHLLPYVDSSTAPAHVANALRTLPFERNIFKVFANADSMFVPFMSLLASCWSEGRALRASEWQLIVLTCAVQRDAPYEWDVNEPVARLLGFNEEHFTAIKAGKVLSSSIPSTLFTPRQRLIYTMVVQLYEQNGVNEETTKEAINVFGAKAVTEVCITHGIYTTIAMVLRTSKTDFDEPIEGLSEILSKVMAKTIEQDASLREQDAQQLHHQQQ